MAYKTITYTTFVNGTTSDGPSVIQNSNDILNGLSDGTKDINVAAIAGTSFTNTGNTTLGNAASDTVTINGTIASHLLFTDNTYDIGASGATRPRNLFLGGNLTVAGNTILGNASGTDTLTVNALSDFGNSITIGRNTTSPVFLEVNNNSLVAGDAYILIDVDGSGVPELIFETPTANWAFGTHTDNSLRIAQSSGDLTSNATIVIDSNRKLTLGKAADTQVHDVNGGLAITTTLGVTGLTTCSAGIAVAGGSAANNTLFVSSNVFTVRAGTSGLSLTNVSDSQIFGYSNAGLVTIGASGDTTTDHVINGELVLAARFGNGGAVGGNGMLKLNGNTLSGTTQIQIDLSTFTANSSATALAGGILIGSTVANSAFTCTQFAQLYLQNITKGAAATITRRYGIFLEAPTGGGTANVALGDTTSFSGSYFLYSSNANPTHIAGYLEIVNQADPGAITDGIRIGSVDISAGNASLSLRTETAVVTESVTSDRTLLVQINGTTYKICLKS